MTQLTTDQIKQFQDLGIDLPNQNPPKQETQKTDNNLNLNHQPSSKKPFPVFPLLSISGLTILSFSGLLLLKSKNTSNLNINNNSNQNPDNIAPSPTQVPKSIQHYLLASQQYFSQALQQQTDQSKDQDQITDLLNQSILTATQAIKEFPNDYRAFLQRGRIYQSLIESQPQFSNQALSDLSQAQKLNPNSAEITRNLASLYAFKGDSQSTINYLQQTIILEPTKAQNFYDLAKIQQQTGLISQAVQTYDQLLSILSDPQQRQQLQLEKSSLEQLLSQNPNPQQPNNSNDLPTVSPLPFNLDSPTIKALAESNLIIAAPEQINEVELSNLTDSNALSGSNLLPANQKKIVVANDNLSPDSQVYITVTKGGKNQNLQLLSKSEKSFTIGLSQAISEDIEFTWWIIN
jgi:hypothetical protein